MRKFLNQHLGLFLIVIILASLFYSYFYMERFSFHGPDPIKVTNDVQVKLREKSQQLLRNCQNEYSSEIDQKRCFNSFYKKYYDYNSNFEYFDIFQVVADIKKEEFQRGFFWGILIPSALYFVFWLALGSRETFNEVVSQGVKRFETSIKTTSNQINQVLENAKQTDNAIVDLKNIIRGEKDNLIEEIQDSKIAVSSLFIDVKEKTKNLQDSIYETSQTIFETAVSRSKDKIVESNREITRETKESIQELKELLSKNEEASAIFVSIAQKKKDNEEKRKFYGKAKSEQRMAKTKQELIEEGRRVLKGDNEGE